MSDDNVQDAITFEWLDGPESQGPRRATEEEWDAIDLICIQRGWMSLNRVLTRVLVAKRSDVIVGFHVTQLVPHAEPLYVDPKERGTELAAQLADKMVEFLIEVKARGWFVVADSPFAKQMCEDRGMVKVKAPVYRTL